MRSRMDVDHWTSATVDQVHKASEGRAVGMLVISFVRLRWR